jgi:hypothetical protein
MMNDPRTRRILTAGVLSALGGVLLTGGTALAQGLPIEATPGPTRAPVRLEPYRPGELPASLPESAAYPRDVGVRLDPAFIEPLVARYETKNAGPVVLGFAGWTPPNVPMVAPQSGAAEVNGWLSVGFALKWGDRR